MRPTFRAQGEPETKVAMTAQGAETRAFRTALTVESGLTVYNELAEKEDRVVTVRL